MNFVPALAQEPLLSEGHEIYNFCTPFLGHPIDLVCRIRPWEYRKLLQKIMHFHYFWQIWPCPSTRTPSLGGHEIHNLGRTSLGHYYYRLSLSDQCLGVEKKIFRSQELLRQSIAIWVGIRRVSSVDIFSRTTEPILTKFGMTHLQGK